MPDQRPLFVTGIGTGIGKTIVSAILVEKLKADYWKPVQSGDLDNSDTMKVKSLVTNPSSVFHPEAYRLTQPFSPHKSAVIDGLTIDRAKLVLPETHRPLIIEGAGGLMVPLNNDFLMIDLIKQLNAEVILVSQNYLGSINHTLLSVSALNQNNIPIKGIVFNGNNDDDSEPFILGYSKIPLIARIPHLKTIDKTSVITAGKLLKGIIVDDNL